MIRAFFVGVLVCFTLTQATMSFANPTIRKHLIIGVDCSGTFQKNNDKRILLNSFKQMMGGEEVDIKQLSTSNLSDVINENDFGSSFFDASTDVITLFSFGMPGNFRTRIWNKYRYDFNSQPDRIFKDLSSSFIFPLYTSKINTNSKEIYDKFSSLFEDSGYNKLFSKYSQGITLSHFVYPCFISSLSSQYAAEEYILVVFSDYKTGSSESDAGDVREVGYILSSSALQKFLNYVSRLRNKFYRIDYFDYSKGDLSVRGFKIRPKAGTVSENAFLSIESDFNLSQESYNGDNYRINSPILLKFSKNERFQIDSILLRTYKNGKEIGINKLAYHETVKDTNAQLITIADKNLTFIHVYNPNDFKEIVCQIDIVGRYQYEKDKSIPFSYSARRILTEKDIEFVTPLTIIIYRIMFILFILLVLVALFLFYVFRGRKTSLSLSLVNADSNRFTEISLEQGTVTLPCDFLNANQNCISYTLRGKIERMSSFSIPWMVNYVYIQPILETTNLQNHKVEIQGGRHASWTEIMVKDNEFVVNVKISFTSRIQKTGRICLQLKCKYSPYIYMMKGKGFQSMTERALHNLDDKSFDEFLNNTKLQSESCILCIERYVRYKIDYPTLWVGIDPGTNGSCLTIGNSSTGSAGKPSILPVTSNNNPIVDSIVVVGGVIEKKPNFNTAYSKPIKDWEPEIDYMFGNKAKQRLNSYVKNGAYCFMSIKKLLGYKRPTSVKIPYTNSAGKIAYKDINITGVELQTLLVKGLIKKGLFDYINNLRTNQQQMDMIFPIEDSCNTDKLRRAVVAIPNNFQLPQIVDMVNSVKDANNFDEVKYIYEPEGILFHYLSQTYNEHKDNGCENIIVFDMGGATINASVFQVIFEKNTLGQVKYKVSTLSRLGYAIGGDDIDYAILEFLMHFSCFMQDYSIDDKRYEVQNQHKTELINLVQQFKVDFVKLYNNASQDSLRNVNNFKDIYLKEIFRIIGKKVPEELFSEQEAKLYCEDEKTFRNNLKDKLLESRWLKKYLYDKLKDAIGDLLATHEVKSLSKINRIIYSGRSTMFPKVTNLVTIEIKDKGFATEEHRINPTELKTAVSRGACWFGMYDGKIVEVDNSRITSSYGIRHTIPGQNEYIEIISQNSKYDIGGKLVRTADVVSTFADNGQYVQFYQVMGRTDDNLFEPSRRFKIRFLVSIPLNGREAMKETISISEKGNVECDVDYPGKPLDEKPKSVNYDFRDITQENDRSYLFSICDK